MGIGGFLSRSPSDEVSAALDIPEDVARTLRAELGNGSRPPSRRRIIPTEDDVATAITQLHTMERIFTAKRMSRAALAKTRARVRRRIEVVAVFRVAAKEAADKRARELLRKGAASVLSDDVRKRLEQSMGSND